MAAPVFKYLATLLQVMVAHALIENKEFARAEALLKDALQHRKQWPKAAAAATSSFPAKAGPSTGMGGSV